MTVEWLFNYYIKQRGIIMSNLDAPILNEKEVVKAKKSMIKFEEIIEVSDFLKVFSDSTRLQILWALDDIELSVGDLCNILNMSKSAISHQLQYLKLNHLVKCRRQGKNIIYSLDDAHVSLIIETARKHLKEKKL